MLKDDELNEDDYYLRYASPKNIAEDIIKSCNLNPDREIYNPRPYNYRQKIAEYHKYGGPRPVDTIRQDKPQAAPSNPDSKLGRTRSERRFKGWIMALMVLGVLTCCGMMGWAVFIAMRG